MSLSDENALSDLFFDPVINCKFHGELRAWLKKQKEEDIRTFLDTFNFDTNRTEESILRQELENRDAKRSQKEKWIDRLVAFITGVVLTTSAPLLKNLIVSFF